MNSRPRLLLINYEYPPLGGGAGTATAGLARALAQLDCDVAVLTSRFRGQPALEHIDGYRVERIRVLRRRADRCSPFEMLTFIFSSMAAVLRTPGERRPDLTIAFFGIPGAPAAWLLRARRGVPYIVSLRGGDVPGFQWGPGSDMYHRITAPAIRFLWRHARAVVANGSGLRELAQRAAPGLDVPVIPNGVDIGTHSPDASVPKASATGAPRILLLGRLAHQKGVDVLLRALAQIRDLRFDVELAGDGPERPALEALARELGLADRIHFTGWVSRDQLPERYRPADIFVLPSRAEGMPNALLEAMSYALPVIATDVPGNRDLVVHERTGLLVAAEDATGLAAAIRRLLDDADLRSRLGNAARAHATERHSWLASAKAYLELGGITAPTLLSDASSPAAGR